MYLRNEADRIVISTADAALDQLSSAVARHFPGDRSPAKELMAERRAEAARDRD